MATDFADRALMALVQEVADLEEHAARVKAMVAAMAKEREIAMPEPTV